MHFSLLLLATATSTGGLHLVKNDGVETPYNTDSSGEKSLTKRNVGAVPVTPSWGFLPIFASPPVIQVHHIIHLQPPDSRCFPHPPTTPLTMPSTADTSTSSPAGRGGDGIFNRFGNNNESTPLNKELSPCIWAIVSCCSPGNADIRYTCFEFLGCQGAFWDRSPCEPRVVQAAANTVLKFYMSAAPPSTNNVIDFEVNDNAK